MKRPCSRRMKKSKRSSEMRFKTNFLFRKANHTLSWMSDGRTRSYNSFSLQT
uniref:Uncharacterized protein n=1 Tax=Utricularia reniformis TaxID=192314 RepID=A0A1Y0B060_9LAMI|nr:hypothetical protein AEK19_MT0566 [Utricularia reniformis]ART30822.1 hypothetical protein AEK19_MT0566 [Utricularia reniformis]